MTHEGTDEFGTRWLVDTHDPANDAINYLKRRGMKIICLPRAVYLAGPGAAVVEYTPSDPLLAARLIESVEVLNARSR